MYAILPSRDKILLCLFGSHGENKTSFINVLLLD